MLAAVVLLFSFITLWLLYLFKSYTLKKKILTEGVLLLKNKGLQRGRLFRCWSSPSESAVTCLRAPFFFTPPENTLPHTVSTVVLDTLSGQPQPWQTTGFSSPFLSHFLFMQSSTHHVQTKQCPHVSVVQPQRLGEILSGQLQVFQPPLSVFHLCEETEDEALNTANKLCKGAARGMTAWHLNKQCITTLCKHTSFQQPLFPVTLSARLSVFTERRHWQKVNIYSTVCPPCSMTDIQAAVPTSAYCSQYKWLWGLVIISSSRQNAAFP